MRKSWLGVTAHWGDLGWVGRSVGLQPRPSQVSLLRRFNSCPPVSPWARPGRSWTEPHQCVSASPDAPV